MARHQAKLIVITGVTRGLGLALAETFIEQGHTVCGCGRSREHIENLRRRFGPPNDFAMVDVSQEGSVEPWAARVLSSRGAPDLLINNAAVINQNAPLWQVPAEEFNLLFDVNVKGVANVIRHFVPAMVARKTGVVVNFSSGWGRSVAKEVGPYCASKWAIEGLTLALAEELPRPMAAVPVNPGIIDTDMLRSCFGGSASRYPSARRWADVAVPFLLGLNSRDNGKQHNVPAVPPKRASASKVVLAAAADRNTARKAKAVAATNGHRKR
jgi:NAD(P)-dependent dehydrogenase (short-subunit alcohol dehydrogenase family)